MTTTPRNNRYLVPLLIFALAKLTGFAPINAQNTFYHRIFWFASSSYLAWFAAAYLLLLPSLSGFLTLNFTGSSTYTSLSGVDSEMKFAVPAQVISAGVAVVLLLVSDSLLTFGGKLV